LKQVKYLIIGAGISGLTAANYLKKDYLLIEKENEPGGYCRTIHRGDYVWDYAGHFFHFKTDEFRRLFHENIPEQDIISQTKRTKILYKGQLVDYPFQTNIHQLEKQEFIDCLYDLFQRKEKTEYSDFLDMLYGKFGKSIVEKFLKPYNEKLYACDLHQFDKDAMGRFFPYADIPQIIANMKREQDSSYNSTFLYPRNGAGSFLDVLYRRLDSTKVRLGCTLTRVDAERKLAYTDGGEEISFEYLINTAPLNHFLAMLGTDAALELNGRLSYNKVLVFNLGFSKKSAFKEHWIYVPDKAVNYYRIGFYDNILSTDKLSMYVEIGYPKDAAVDTEQQLALTLENLKRCGIVTEDNSLIASSTILMDPAYVHIRRDTEAAIAEMKRSLAVSGIHTIGRYGGWTYCSMEDCMLEAKELVQALR
jgi:protoporphyrinogen oxidase